MNDRPDREIRGAGRIEGGLFGTLKIKGAGTVAGSVDANVLHTSGTAHISGDVKAKELECSGSFNVAGKVEAAQVRTGGSTNIKGGIKGDEIELRGAFNTGADVNASQSVKGAGAINVQGTLAAPDIEITLNGNSRVRAIRGGNLVVREAEEAGSGNVSVHNDGGSVSVSMSGIRGADGESSKGGRGGRGGSVSSNVVIGNVSVSGGKATVSVSGGTGESRLDADEISGDSIELVNTTAKSVSGKRVKIGPGCDIQRVEYSESLDVDKSAKVGTKSKR